MQPAAPAAQPPKPSAKDIMRQVLTDKSITDSIAKACGKHQDMFVATLMEVYAQDGKLRQCDPRYIIAEGLKAVTLGLPLNRKLGFAYILPFNETVKDANGNKVPEVDPQTRQVMRWSNGAIKYQKRMTPQLVIGYRGYIQMALRTGLYVHINTDVVCEGQLRTVNFLTGEYDFNGTKESDTPVGYFAYIELKSGFSKTIYMTLDEMCAYAIMYGNGIPSGETATSLKKKALEQVVTGPKGLGWSGDFESMALKTTLRRNLMTYGIITPEMSNVFTNDRDYNYSGEEDSTGEGSKTVINLDSSSNKFDNAVVVESTMATNPAEQTPKSAAPQTAQQSPDDGPGY